MRRPLWLVAIAGVLAACGSNSHRAQSARVDCITITGSEH